MCIISQTDSVYSQCLKGITVSLNLQLGVQQNEPKGVNTLSVMLSADQWWDDHVEVL